MIELWLLLVGGAIGFVAGALVTWFYQEWRWTRTVLEFGKKE